MNGRRVPKSFQADGGIGGRIVLLHGKLALVDRRERRVARCRHSDPKLNVVCLQAAAACTAASVTHELRRIHADLRIQWADVHRLPLSVEAHEPGHLIALAVGARAVVSENFDLADRRELHQRLADFVGSRPLQACIERDQARLCSLELKG